MDTIKKILRETTNKLYPKYTEFRIHSIDISQPRFQKLILELNKKKNITATYNRVTKICNVIGVYDNNGQRWYDFDDEIHSLTNKGIDYSTT